ncbi:MAG: FkbM family methyltransferase [Phycisphaeraceae bacterium]|nr:FkbM family methyltransferase [Phycisphaeraceae bacterium]
MDQTLQHASPRATAGTTLVEPKPRRDLNTHRANTHSQFGEDGLIEHALGVLRDAGADLTGWCVEFGAWDAVQFSNTRRLIDQQGYTGVFIEADARRHRELLERSAGIERIIPIHAMVGFTPSDSLDTILDRTDCPERFDVLSIDIDGNDYHAWAAVERYRPRLVVIEFNPTIPNSIEFVQAADPRVMHGASLAALTGLARQRGYELIATTSINALYVERESYPQFGLIDNSLDALHTDTSMLTYLFHGYDGTVFVGGHARLIWHKLPIAASRCQQLPGMLRAFPRRYGPLRRALWNTLKKTRNR